MRILVGGLFIVAAPAALVAFLVQSEPIALAQHHDVSELLVFGAYGIVMTLTFIALTHRLDPGKRIRDTALAVVIGLSSIAYLVVFLSKLPACSPGVRTRSRWTRRNAACRRVMSS